ncbi:MAG: high-potential iron-sulfur protein [Curvibacter sp.]|nr:high-potential iron-sulfur protein [Curvibacter sp.]
MSNRREFFVQLSVGTGVMFAAAAAMADAPMVAESDPQAAALGYKADSSKVDNGKFPKHAADQHCGNCALFQGKASDASGGCPLFAGKSVSAKGWCSAYNKKA